MRSRLSLFRGILTICAALLSISQSSAADWPSWRGPNRDGRSPDKGFPTTWSATENIRWKTPIPGSGHSSPVVAQGKIFLTSCDESEKKRLLHCLDRQSGQILWTRDVLVSPLEGKHKLNSFASSTPAVDGSFVYITFYDQPRIRVYCYDLQGNKVWEASPGEFHSKHGFCSSPLVYQNLLIVNGDQDAIAFVVAMDKHTGKEVWRADRPNRTRSYCPPVVFEAAGKPQLVLTGSKSVASYNPLTGEQYWVIDGPTEQFVSSMVFDSGLLFLTAGFPEYWVMAIRPDGTGNVTKSHVAWSKKNEGGYVPSPVAHDGHFYVVTDNGLGTCWNARTGAMMWKERLGRHYSGSAVYAEGKVYFVDDDGLTHVLNASPTFEVLAKNSLGEHVYSSPAFSDGQIFIRGDKHLFCIGK